MALFEVPGWSIPSVARPTSQPRKRKRPGANSNDSEKMQSAEVNIEKLMKKLDSGSTKSDSQNSKNGKKARQDHAREVDDSRQRASKSTTSEGMLEKHRKKRQKKGEVSAIDDEIGTSYDGAEGLSGAGDARFVSSNVKKRDSEHAPQTAGNSSKSKRLEKSPKKDKNIRKSPHVSQIDANPASDTKLTALQSKMRQTLDGARFR